MTVEVLSLGCRLNISESEELRGMLGHGDKLVVVNSCAVTSEAVRQTRQTIRKARRANPDARLLVTGCAAGIGFAIAESLAEQGAQVIGLDIDKEIPDIMAKIGAIGIVVNLTEDQPVQDAIDFTVREFGGIGEDRLRLGVRVVAAGGAFLGK